jgi:6-pyruvoyltetrahydropterin/6-carboxytetrahydropterin synthase
MNLRDGRKSVKKITYVSRRAHFSAAHRLHNPELTDEENRRIYDKCNNPSGHGHNYDVEVTVAGEVDPDTGMVIDLKILKRLLNDHVIEKLDHKHLNHDVDFMSGIIPTAENIAIKIWEQLEPHITSGKLHCVKLYESQNNYVEYRGE